MTTLRIKFDDATGFALGGGNTDNTNPGAGQTERVFPAGTQWYPRNLVSSDTETTHVSRWDGAALVNEPRSTHPSLLAEDRRLFKGRAKAHRDHKLATREDLAFEYPAASGQLFFPSQKTLAQLSALDSAMNPNALGLITTRDIEIDAGTNAGSDYSIADYDDLKLFTATFMAAFNAEYAVAKPYLTAVDAQTTRAGMAGAIQAYLES